MSCVLLGHEDVGGGPQGTAWPPSSLGAWAGRVACREVTGGAECPIMDLIIACPCVIYLIICQSKSYRPMKSLFFLIFNILSTLGVLFPTRSISLI